MRAVLSIGSNMGESLELLRSVVEAFCRELVACSDVYSTPPWGVTEQPDFLNATLVVETTDSPEEVLERGFALERAAHRVRKLRWGPRSLDVDLIAAWGEDGTEITSDTDYLELPHPRAHLRAFVLVPWVQIEPGAVLGGTPIKELIARLDPQEVAAVTPGARLEEAKRQ